MNTHSLTETIRRFLVAAMPDLAVHTPISNGELSTPYVLLSCIAEAEVIPGNDTWECSLEISLHSPAHDDSASTMREQFSAFCELLSRKTTIDAVNDIASDFVLYGLILNRIDEPQTQDDDFIQTATYRVVIQF